MHPFLAVNTNRFGNSNIKECLPFLFSVTAIFAQPVGRRPLYEYIQDEGLESITQIVFLV